MLVKNMALKNAFAAIVAVFMFAAMLFVGVPAFAAPATDDSLQFSGKAGDYFHVQGSCNFPTGSIPTLCPQGSISGSDLCSSTWSCRGDGKDMLKATYKTGLKVCAYLDNSGDQGYFVPMNTATEWLAFSNTNNTPPDVRIVVGCEGGVKQDPCGNEYTLPDVRVSDDPKDVYHFNTSGDYAVDFTCPATIKVTNKATGIESTQPVVNCGAWQIKETGSCTESAGLTFNGAICSQQAKSVEFAVVLDASGSMDQLLGGAQNALRSLVGKYLVPRTDIPVTVTVIGGDGYSDVLNDPSKENCTYGKLFGPLAANATQINSAVGSVTATNNTPIDTTLRYTADFFQDRSKRRVILVLSDGYETCFGNAAFAVQQLRAKGIEIYGIKYGEGQDTEAKAFFTAMNSFSPANSQDQIIAAMESIVKDVTEKSCKPVLRLYKPGDTNGQEIYTILAGQSVKVKRGTYDAVVDYCTGKQTFLNQKVEADRNFDFNQQNCPK